MCEKEHQWYWGGKGSFTKHIANDYGLTPREYYNLVVFGTINYVKICPVCGQNEVEFVKLSKGYREYCSQKCTARASNTIMQRFLAYGYSTAWLYIADVNDNPSIMKFGITGIRDYNTRQNYRGHYLSNHRYILEGNPKLLVKIEQLVDERFCDGTELFESDRQSDLEMYVKELYEKGSTTIP